MKTQRLLLFLILLPLQLCAAVGDWVFRAGTGRESAMIRYLDGGEYSHIGIVVAVAPEIRIIHATTDDDPTHPNQVINSSFAEFSAPPLAGKIAAARPAFLNESERAQLAAAVARHLGEPFHLTARDQSPRYCTTIIYDALITLRPATAARWRHLDLPLLAGDYLFPQALAELPGLEWL